MIALVALAIACCVAALLVLALAYTLTGRDYDVAALILALTGVTCLAISFGAQS